MKTSIYKIGFILFLLVLLFSCDNEPIFSTISKELPLTEGDVIEGNVYAVVEAKDYVFAVNGKIYRKSTVSDDATTNFVEMAKPVADGVLAQKIACDNTFVYALFTNNEVYASPIQEELSWTIVTSDEVITGLLDNYGIAATDSKAVYCVTEEKIYLLDGYSFGAEVTTGLEALENGAAAAIRCCHLDSGDYFFETNVSASNRSNMLYYAEEDKVFYGTDGTNWTDVSVEIGEPRSIEYYSYNQEEYLYVGTASGLLIIDVEDGIPTEDIDLNPGTNADSSFGAYYVSYLFSVPFDSGNAFASVFYPSTSEYNKLWGYYDSTAKWDLETIASESD